jgi:hypothetical protein
MLAAQFADYDHGRCWLINEIPALFDLGLYPPFELLSWDKVIDKSVVEQHRFFRPLTVAREDIAWYW